MAIKELYKRKVTFADGTGIACEEVGDHLEMQRLDQKGDVAGSIRLPKIVADLDEVKDLASDCHNWFNMM